MPVIQVKDKQHTLKPGQTRIGAGPGVDVSVSGDETLGLQAVMELAGNNQVVIRRARDNAAVRVNGVPLVEPTPLMHGDKVDVAGTEIVFSEDKKVGSTQFVSASEVAGVASKRSGPAKATGSTGGRLVSLVDGKEYQIPTVGVTFGREAGSDVVVAQPEVSRKHATIAPSDTGYVLTDHSTNGVWVNGTRVQGAQVLARADIVRVGSEEFRFYADLVKGPTPAVSASAVPSAPAPAPAARPAPTPTSSAPSAPGQAAAPLSSAPAAAPRAATPAASSAASPPAAPAAQPSQPAWSPPPQASTPSMPPAAPAAPQAPAAAPVPPAIPAAGPPPAASHAGVHTPIRREPASAPAAPRGSRSEPPTAPSAVRGPSKGKREPTLATREAKGGGVSAVVWVLLLIVVAVGAYLLGQRGR